MEFDWDEAKSAANEHKHGVSFEEAMTVFEDALSLTANDKVHSDIEERFATIGMSEQGRLLVIAHTDRNGKIRLINARKATRSERKAYENDLIP